MTATRKQIEKWFEDGKKIQATHMIVVTDTFDYENYPVYVTPGMCAHTMMTSFSNMQRPEEVYNLLLSLEEQLNKERCWEL